MTTAIIRSILHLPLDPLQSGISLTVLQINRANLRAGEIEFSPWEVGNAIIVPPFYLLKKGKLITGYEFPFYFFKRHSSIQKRQAQPWQVGDHGQTDQQDGDERQRGNVKLEDRPFKAHAGNKEIDTQGWDGSADF